VPYVLKNAPCAVWVVREADPRGARVKIVIVGCGRVGAVSPATSTRPATRSSSWTCRPQRSTGCRRASGIRAARRRHRRGHLAGRPAEDADVFIAMTEGDNGT
jgi:hypothetical protein